MQIKTSNNQKMICRNNLSYKETTKRLQKYFPKQTTFNIMISANKSQWSDGDVKVICTNKNDRRYSIEASGIYAELVQP